MKNLFWLIIGVWLIVGIVEMTMTYGWVGGVVALVIAPATIFITMLSHLILGIASIIVLTIINSRVH